MRLISTVGVKQIMKVMVQEMTDDLQQSKSVIPLKKSYSETPWYTLYIKRVVWLIALILINLISSSVIAFFEETLAKNIALTFFIPLLIGTGGNVGTQASTLIISAMATKDVVMKDYFKVLGRDLLTSLFIGTTLGFFSFFVGYFIGGLNIGFIVGITIILITIVSNSLGVSLPFLFTLLKLDPSVASGPCITSILDALGLLIYFAVAMFVLDVIGFTTSFI
jgi:magnesium transporter